MPSGNDQDLSLIDLQKWHPAPEVGMSSECLDLSWRASTGRKVELESCSSEASGRFRLVAEVQDRPLPMPGVG